MTRKKEVIENKKQMRFGRELLKALPPAKRDELYWAGLGPGEGYIGTWKIVHSLRHSLMIINRALTLDDLPDKTRDRLEKDKRYYTERIMDCYAMVMPYEKARLKAITISGDPDHPVHVEHDLSVLSDEELDFLARILPKLGGATSDPIGPEAAEGDATGGLQRRRRS
jgi:hypothetical protein